MSVGYIDTSAELQEEEPTIWVTWLQPALDAQQSLQNQSSSGVAPLRRSLFSRPISGRQTHQCPARTFEGDPTPA